jgi:type IV secretory pathway TrbD component
MERVEKIDSGADRKAVMLSGILEAVVANPPHLMNIIRDFIAFYGFAVAFNDDVTFT